MKTTVWTFVTDDDCPEVGVYGTEHEAYAALREWALYCDEEPLPDNDSDMLEKLVENGIWFQIHSHEVDIP